MIAFPYKVLVADDDPAVLDAYREVLSPARANDGVDDLEAELFGGSSSSSPSMALEVVYCQQGTQAVEAVRRAHDEGHPFAVAFLDVRMPPGLSGVETAERIRQLDTDLQIVFVTGFSDVQPDEMSERLPPVDRLFYVAKPFQPPELLQFVRTLTNKWRTEKELQQAHAELEARHRALQEHERELREQNVRLDAALGNMSQGLCLFDSEQRLVICNHRFLDMYRLPYDFGRAGVPMREIVQGMIAAGNYRPEDAERVLADHLALSHETVYRRSREELWDGRVVSVAHNPMPDGRFVNTYEDITQLQRAEDRIKYLAHYDVLTGLPNRAHFNERLEQELARIERRSEAAAILCLDLDHFKSVNDTLGHQIGDALLAAAAERLQDAIRETDVVARLGGDEFAVLVTDTHQPDVAAITAQRLVDTLAAPFEIEGHQIVVGASVGIALVPSDGNSAEQLLKHADLALYRAKADGRSTFRFFEPEMDARMQERRELELDLRRALVAGELLLYYQPLINIHQPQRIAGFEALVRWQHPKRGLLLPGAFIPLAEETGLITQIGMWVLNRACADAAKWERAVTVAVNLSPVQFQRDDLAHTVGKALLASGLPAERLELEITESVLLAENEKTLEILHRLREMRVRICMDDFGTGYSSLGYLRRFPFDKIKIDRSFVSDIGKAKDAETIIETVVRLAGGLGMGTTGEGVETQLQLDYLRSVACMEVQGYYFSKPRPAEEVAALLSSDIATLREQAECVEEA